MTTLRKVTPEEWEASLEAASENPMYLANQDEVERAFADAEGLA